MTDLRPLIILVILPLWYAISALQHCRSSQLHHHTTRIWRLIRLLLTDYSYVVNDRPTPRIRDEVLGNPYIQKKRMKVNGNLIQEILFIARWQFCINQLTMLNSRLIKSYLHIYIYIYIYRHTCSCRNHREMLPIDVERKWRPNYRDTPTNIIIKIRAQPRFFAKIT